MPILYLCFPLPWLCCRMRDHLTTLFCLFVYRGAQHCAGYDVSNKLCQHRDRDSKFSKGRIIVLIKVQVDEYLIITVQEKKQNVYILYCSCEGLKKKKKKMGGERKKNGRKKKPRSSKSSIDNITAMKLHE